MASVIDEQTQFIDQSTSALIVNGFIYIGNRNADPRVAQAIFSDRELTTALANPQRTDSSGRSVNKIWIGGRYSIEVSNSDDVQKYIELDNGEGAGAGVIALSDVQGANTITATASTTITALEDLQQYVFRTAQINTGAITLNIDSVGAKSILKNHTQAIVASDFEANQNIVVTFNATDDLLVTTATYPTSGPQTAVAFETVIANTTGGAFTVNLPATPAQSDYVSFEVGADYSTNNLTIGRNGESIMGDAADMVISTNSPVKLRYNGTEWRIA